MYRWRFVGANKRCLSPAKCGWTFQTGSRSGSNSSRKHVDRALVCGKSMTLLCRQFAAIFTIPYATPLPPWKAFPIYVRATDRWAPKWSHLTTSTDVDCTAALCINYLEYGDAGKTHRLEKYAISFWRDCCQAWHKCFLIAPFWLRLCVSRNCKLG